MTVLVMAGGHQRRWDGPGLKQMAEICGEPIIHRTMRQLGRPVTLVCNPEQRGVILDGAPYAGAHEWIDSSDTDFWVQGFLATKKAWSASNTCILGDVWFTDDAIRRLTQDMPGGIHVVGRHGLSPYTGGPGETFALTWDIESEKHLVEACEAALDHAQTFPAGTYYDAHGCPLGTPWQPYRLLAGFRPEEHGRDERVWVEHSDWTDDVDSYAHYKRLSRRLAAQFGK